MNKRKGRADIVRNFVFGVEDSLVSTVGLLAGVATGGESGKSLILVGVVLIFVEAFSMGVGSFLSAESATEYMNKKEAPLGPTLLSALTMFVSYLIAGLIPLTPYLFTRMPYSYWLSVGLTLVALLLLGFFNGRAFGISPWKSGIRMLLLGGLAVGIGIVVGHIVKSY